MKYLSLLLILISVQLHALTFKSDGTVENSNGTISAKGHPIINEGFMYNNYPCCEGKDWHRIIKSKNHPFWNGVPIPEGLDKKKVPSISFTDPFDYNNIDELDANYFLAYEWSKKEYAKDIYEIITENNGNKFLAISAENGKNTRTDSYGNLSERGELWIPFIKLKDKEFWYGWKMKLAPDFENYGSSNLKFHQILDQPQSLEKGCKFPKFSMDWKTTPSNIPTYIINNTRDQGTKKMGKNCERRESFKKYSTIFKDASTVPFAYKDKWVTYKIGIFNTDSDQGFLKVYLNDELIHDYSGPTISYEVGYDKSIINFGAYRRTNIKHPIQTLYFDDLTFVADKETLDRILD